MVIAISGSQDASTHIARFCISRIAFLRQMRSENVERQVKFVGMFRRKVLLNSRQDSEVLKRQVSLDLC